MPNNCLKIENLAVYRSDLPLFEPVSFSVCAGESIQISGTNGSGKTSLLRCICGISHRHQGRILWNADASGKGHASVDANSYEDDISDMYGNMLYIGHSLGLKPKLTVEQNLKFYQQLRFPQNAELIETALEQLNIGIYHDEEVGNLSAGQKRRVSLARLLTEPVSLWVLDEPMVALDLDGQAWLENVCNKHIAHGGLILLTSHQQITGINGLVQLELKEADIKILESEELL
ncbi:MAG: cytochrome c biogenesis heme-transporting ATPase CcmA [Kangiellaceae bacterium]|nr:cytochrome c biogenesis heme-transporting ATPase CcmA [Kangiellaceae bacterium]